MSKPQLNSKRRFLFEGQFGTVLYTGDFRIARGDGRKFQAFMTNPPMSEYGLKSIDHIYVDCTFCSETAHAFPSRDASVKATTDLIQDWLIRGPDYKVLFSLAGRGFGAEFVFVEVYRRLKIKVHVSTFKLEIYKSLSNELYDSITNDATTSLHACCNNLHNDCVRCVQILNTTIGELSLIFFLVSEIFKKWFSTIIF